MSQATVPTEAMPPELQVRQLLMSQLVSRLIYVVAEIKLPDHLADGPKTAEQLASATGTYAPALYRMLRTMASFGFFTEDAQQRFSLKPLGEVLKSGTPTHAAALVLGGAVLTRSIDNLLYSIQTGKTGFEKAFGKPLFDWLGANPTQADLFNQTMIGFHGTEPPAVAAAYDFSGFKTIVDVGGSTGNLLAAILQHHAAPRGILFDLPHVVHDAPALLEARGVAARVTIEPGSFFEKVPAGADAYTLSHVIHDWNQDQCLTILGHCRRAMNPNGRVLLIEMVLPEGDAPHPGKMLDMAMLICPGGEERRASDYSALLDQAGLRMTRVIPTASAVSVVEAVAR